MEAFEEVVLGEKLAHKLLALQILQFTVRVGHAWAEKGALQPAVAPPLLPIRQNKRPVALTDAFANHDHSWPRAVDVAALLEQLAGNIVSTKVDDGVTAVDHAKDGAVFPVHLGVSPPRMRLGHLTKVSEYRDARWPWRELPAEGIVAVRDDCKHECYRAQRQTQDTRRSSQPRPVQTKMYSSHVIFLFSEKIKKIKNWSVETRVLERGTMRGSRYYCQSMYT
jgi:hypothetical protein